MMDQIRDRMRAEIERRGISQSAVARSLDVSETTFSMWLKGTYDGNVRKIDRKAQAWIDREEEKKQLPKTRIPYQVTTVASKVHEVVRLCHLDGEMGVVIGAAGLGKTTALREYAEENPDTILIEADHGYTARSLLGQLMETFGLEPVRSLHPMLLAVVERLKGSGRLILIDEAEHLPYKALELIRRVHDHAEIGVVLAGMPRLFLNIKGKRTDFAQLYSRVGVLAELKGLTLDDTKKIVAATLPDASPLARTYHTASGGNARRLTKLLARSARVAHINKREVDAEVIERAQRMLIA